MTRKLAATILAVIVSIPATPYLVRSIRHLTNTGDPTILPAKGWKIKGQADLGKIQDSSGNNHGVKAKSKVITERAAANQKASVAREWRKTQFFAPDYNNAYDQNTASDQRDLTSAALFSMPGTPPSGAFSSVGAGNQISVTDANNNTTQFKYHQLNRRTAVLYPDTTSDLTAYDAAGRTASKTDQAARTTSFQYDPLGHQYDEFNRLFSKRPDPFFAAPTVTLTYTATGQRASMQDASGTTTYTYDRRDRLTQKATPEGTLSYAYDANGNLTSMASSNVGGVSVSYSYDELNRLAGVTDNRLAVGVTTYSYDNVGNLQGYLYPNGVATTYQYNALNRLTNVTISKGTPIASYAYTLGPSGNRTAVAELGGRNVGYTYDALYRLTGETMTGSSTASANGVIGYIYDPVGNRQSRTSTVAAIPASTYTYDANEHLDTDTYDANGSTLVSGGNTYTYDFENHLISQGGPNPVTIVYDRDGNRVAETVAGKTTQYLVDDRSLSRGDISDVQSAHDIPQMPDHGPYTLLGVDYASYCDNSSLCISHDPSATDGCNTTKSECGFHDAIQSGDVAILNARDRNSDERLSETTGAPPFSVAFAENHNINGFTIDGLGIPAARTGTEFGEFDAGSSVEINNPLLGINAPIESIFAESTGGSTLDLFRTYRTPRLLMISPNSILQGQQSLSVVITGQVEPGSAVTLSGSLNPPTGSAATIKSQPNVTFIDSDVDSPIQDYTTNVSDNRPGWYSLDLPDSSDPLGQGELELDFMAEDGSRQRITLESSCVFGGKRVAWIHFNRPRALRVTSRGKGPTLRAVGKAELLSRLRDISLAKAELTEFFLGENLVFFVWIFTVCLTRILANRMIGLLPRNERARAREEVSVMLKAAKWAGIGCYLIWTVKDILSGVGIVYVN
jgi:YD repeat-containing protein